LHALNPSYNRTDLNKIITKSGVNINELNPGFAGKLGQARIDYLTAVNCVLAGCR
jgi:hypothetical protein